MTDTGSKNNNSKHLSKSVQHLLPDYLRDDQDNPNNINLKFNEIMEKFPSSGNVIPKKLNFESVNNSLETTATTTTSGSAAKKRKYSDFMEHNSHENHIQNNSNTSISRCNSVESLNSSNYAPSPWEIRRIKADYLESKALIVKLKLEIEQQNKLIAYKEEMHKNKVDSLIKQCDFSSNKIADVEKHLSMVRKREKESKTELVNVKNELIQQKQSYEEKLNNLQKEYNDFQDNSRAIQSRLQNDLAEVKRQNERLKYELDMIKQEVNNYKITSDEYKDKALKYDNVKAELELEKQEHDRSKSHIRQLEHELQSYGEWKDLTKNTHARLMNLSELEKEVQRLRLDNKNLRDNIGNKLLLEEQVFDLKSQLERYEKSTTDLASLKVQIVNLEDEIRDWKKLAEDHCPKTSPMTPISLRQRIEQLLQKDIILTSEKGLTQNERESFQGKIRDLQVKNEIYLKENTELNNNVKKQKIFTQRVQKKLMIIINERNLYKQLAENIEKDFTVSTAMMDADPQLKARVELLEKSLSQYKELCSKLQKEIDNLTQMPDLPFEAPPSGTESYERLKKEIETLRIENDRLRRRKEELELEMEQRCLKGDFNIERYKILHLTNNPAAEAYEKHQNEVEKLQAEIERLKRKIRKLEDDRVEMTHRLNETTNSGNMTVNIKEINQLKSKLESQEAKCQHLKEIYKTASLEFREVVYMLFGYRVDRIGNANYRISSMYAENEDEYLNFRLNESGILDMLESEYSKSIGNLVRQHLAVHKSLPAFLSTLTLELFNRITIG